jgi:hypothetical protein
LRVSPLVMKASTSSTAASTASTATTSILYPSYSEVWAWWSLRDQQSRGEVTADPEAPFPTSLPSEEWKGRSASVVGIRQAEPGSPASRHGQLYQVRNVCCCSKK